MTASRETADVLRQARAVHGAPPARRSTSAPPLGAGEGSPRADAAAAPPGEPSERGAVSPLERPEDGDPRPNSPEDVGFSAAPARPRPRRKTDREFLEALPGGAFRGVTALADPLFPFEAVVRRRDGRELATYGKTESEALGKLRAEVEKMIGGTP